jgi:hypothetical protein
LFLRTVFAVGRLTELDHLLEPARARTMAELEKRLEGPKRKRGRT